MMIQEQHEDDTNETRKVVGVTATINNYFDDDDDDTNNDVRGERILTLLDATKASPSLVDRQEYENRLLTFRASTYYAKPPCLSPMFCARFGYVRSLPFFCLELCVVFHFVLAGNPTCNNLTNGKRVVQDWSVSTVHFPPVPLRIQK
jgi:hypothetical protein